MTPSATISAAGRWLLTGGSGFVGRSLLDYLRRHPAAAPRSITVLSRRPEEFRRASPELAAGVRLIAGDIRDFAFPDGEFDRVIHAAAPVAERVGDEEFRSIELAGTRRILEFCRRQAVKKLLFISSGAVYGPLPAGEPAFTETLPAAPRTPYGAAKLAAEQLCLDGGTPAVIARGFAFCGRHLPLQAHFAIGNFIADAVAGRPIVINGDGTPVRSYLDADDLARWLLVLLDDAPPGTICNVGSDRALSMRELAENVRETLGCAAPVIVRGVTRRDAPVDRYVPDIRRARRDFGLIPTVTLEESIRRTAAR